MRDMGLTECYSFDGKEEKKLTSFNDALLAERSVCPVEEFTFTYKGIELDGYVMKPVDYDPNKTYPGILTIHGGTRSEATAAAMSLSTLQEGTAPSTLSTAWP